ncbi:MAG TPA: helix-turn-helix transcriptional regulator [Gemmatimonadales bacterium]|nr:helix-turn-helix transcriptional regulator [Gemmatimonadales bacterium]
MTRPKAEPPRGVLKTAVVEPRGLRHERFHCSSDLEPWVEHFWVVEWDFGDAGPQRVETLPHPSVHMIFEGGKSRITGITRARFIRMLEGKGGVFAVKFRPGGFYPFAGFPISRLSDKTVELAEIFGADGMSLEHTVLAERTDDGRIAAIETFLRNRRPPPDENVTRLSEMVYAVARERGILKVEDLVHRYGINKRTLQRLFAKYVGVSPKWVIQRYRLHEAAEQLKTGETVGQAALALSLGYTDQAHFVRDFKATVGTSPGAYARARGS